MGSMNKQVNKLNTPLGGRLQELPDGKDDLASLLADTDIGMITVDADCCVRHFTAAAARLVPLRASDVGRSLDHAATNLVDLDLAREVKRVLADAVPAEREVDSRDGKRYSIRILPSSADRIRRSAVIMFIDVTTTTAARVRAEEELRHLNQTLGKRVRERSKWLTLMHAVTRLVDDAPNWDDALRIVLHRVCEVGRWQVGCVYLPDPDHPEEIVASISCAEGKRFEPFRAASVEMRFRGAQCLPGLVHAGGEPVWANGQDEVLKLVPLRVEAARQAGITSAAALPIAARGHVIAVLELFSDQPHRRNDELMALVNDVGGQIGRVLERERLMGQVAELVWSEQQGLIHTLHDTLGQELTGVALLGSSLAQRLKKKDPEAAETARRIAECSQQSLELVRQLSKGLFPVEVDAKGLMLALEQLASTTETVYRIPCRLELADDVPVLISDNRAATQLYRIAQEAVTNALRHARAEHITIRMSANGPLTTLVVADDGVGIGQTGLATGGMGLRIMRYRAMSIGARLAVERGLARGTTVTCALWETPRHDEYDSGASDAQRA